VRLLTRKVKLARYFPAGRRIAGVVRQRVSQLVATVCGLMLVLVIAASLMYFAETRAQPDEFPSIPAAMWWDVVTLTTVGYGDTVPITPAARLLAAVIAVLGIGLFALPAGILSAGLSEANALDEAEGGQPEPPSTGEVCPHCGQPLPVNQKPD
jgi:voltage-gated potassium channel